MKKLITLIVVAVALSGCGSMSGLEASNSFSCKASPGVNCQSISGVHQNAIAGNLPFQLEEQESNTKEGEKKPYDARARTGTGSTVSPRDMNAQYSGMPVRQPPLVLRVWMAPYEDESGDLHDQSYFYTMVHSGKWMIEANRNAIANQFTPIHPLVRPNSSQEQGEKESRPAKQPYEVPTDKNNQ